MEIGSTTWSPTRHQVGDVYKVQSFCGRKTSLNFKDILKIYIHSRLDIF